MTNSTDTQTANTKTEVIDRVMYLSQRCEEYALALEERRRRLATEEDSDVTLEQVLAAGERLVEVRRELRDFLAVSVR